MTDGTILRLHCTPIATKAHKDDTALEGPVIFTCGGWSSNTTSKCVKSALAEIDSRRGNRRDTTGFRAVDRFRQIVDQPKSEITV
jgi:hypothetical protein